MSKSFLVTPGNDEEFVVVSVRMRKSLRDEFHSLAGKSNHSRNELLCMALEYALEHLEFVDNPEQP